MKFNTPCFVRVEDPAERKELIEWLRDIGYDFNPALIEDGDRYMAVGNNAFATTYFPPTEYSSKAGFIDCGTNIPLFRALAAMNDENDREQLMACKNTYRDPSKLYAHFDGYPKRNKRIRSFEMYEKLLTHGANLNNWRKATAREIVEHFKTKEK